MRQKTFIGWTLWNADGVEIRAGDYSPSSPKSVNWMTRFIVWAIMEGHTVVFASQHTATDDIIENT